MLTNMSQSSIIAKAKERYEKDIANNNMLLLYTLPYVKKDVWSFLEQEIITAISEYKRGIKEKVEGMKTKYTGQNDSIEVGKILVLNKVIRLLSEEVPGEGSE